MSPIHDLWELCRNNLERFVQQSSPKAKKFGLFVFIRARWQPKKLKLSPARYQGIEILWRRFKGMSALVNLFEEEVERQLK